METTDDFKLVCNSHFSSSYVIGSEDVDFPGWRCSAIADDLDKHYGLNTKHEETVHGWARKKV